MNYQIYISGIHCEGCKNLITLVLNDLGFTNVTVDLNTHYAKFSSNKSMDEVNKDLEKTFIEELNNYEYSDLKII